MLIRVHLRSSDVDGFLVEVGAAEIGRHADQFDNLIVIAQLTPDGILPAPQALRQAGGDDSHFAGAIPFLEIALIAQADGEGLKISRVPLP